MHEGAALVTYLPRAGVPETLVVNGATVLEADSPVVWFTFPDRWHDIGRFHLPDGRFTGLYANILTPVCTDGDLWRTTDLFLDLFLTPDGTIHRLDEDDLLQAERDGHIAPSEAATARSEADRLVRAARDGLWPPPVVAEWTLEAARAAAAGHPGPAPGVSGSTLTGGRGRRRQDDG